MELTTDVLLRGTAWNRAIDALSPIFRARPHYMLYMLSMSIGIMYDQRIQKPEENGEDVRSIPRNVFHNNDNGKLDVSGCYPFHDNRALLGGRTIGAGLRRKVGVQKD